MTLIVKDKSLLRKIKTESETLGKNNGSNDSEFSQKLNELTRNFALQISEQQKENQYLKDRINGLIEQVSNPKKVIADIKRDKDGKMESIIITKVNKK